jgi:hypothetical protein
MGYRRDKGQGEGTAPLVLVGAYFVALTALVAWAGVELVRDAMPPVSAEYLGTAADLPDLGGEETVRSCRDHPRAGAVFSTYESARVADERC